ncbi:hypothetical protein G9A89_015857 [Geosiphon pyriformis]|nr:hypothetical protein G9A89_015857 [Geosiphon pyriformis]
MLPVWFGFFLVPVYLLAILCVMFFASSMKLFYLVSLWKRLDPCGPVPVWFVTVIQYFHDSGSFDVCSFPLDDVAAKNILESYEFRSVHNRLFGIDAFGFFVYMDSSLYNLGSVNMKAGAAAFFENINLGLGIEVTDMVFSTLMELQAIALVLECVPSLSSVCLFSDSQAALNVCKAELLLSAPDFQDKYWIKRHLGVLNNDQANLLVGVSSYSDQLLPFWLKEYFVLASGSVVSGNSKHFVHDTLVPKLWTVHPNSYMAAGFTSCYSAGSYFYFIKALHHRLPVAVRKCLYNKHYPSVMCLYCDNVEVSDYVFSCPFDATARL